MSLRVIGLTGGIGSGKTTVAKILEGMGYKIYYADLRARTLLQENAAVVNQVKAAFGNETYRADGSPDRARIASIVFSDEEKLKMLNSIVHPAVAKDFEEWQQALLTSNYDKPFALKEAAILFESGSYKTTDGVIVVSAPEEVRVQRVVERDKVTAQQVKDRMAAQMSEEERISRADFVIHNDGQQMLIPQVLEAIRHFSPHVS